MCGCDLEVIGVPSIFTHSVNTTGNKEPGSVIRQYLTDYNNRPSNFSIFLIPVIASPPGSLHNEFILLLFLEDHRETDRFFESSGVQIAQSTSGLFPPSSRGVLLTGQDKSW